MPQTVYHVVPYEERWAIKREGVDRAVRVADSRKDMIGQAETMAQNQAPGRVVIHAEDGTIESVHTYSSVPARVDTGREWLDVVLSKPVLAGVGVAFLVAVGFSMRDRF